MKKPSSTDLKRLKEVYETHGIKSAEFYEVVKGFIIFVIRRYNFHYNEELFFSAYCQILESSSHYDPTKLNIGSFIYSVVRNRISSFHYHKRKRDYESDAPLEFLPSEENGYRKIENDMARRRSLSQSSRVKYTGDPADIVNIIMEDGEDSLHFRNMIWTSRS